MSKFQFSRDNILSVDERRTAARKCLSILKEVPDAKFRAKDWTFVEGQRSKAKSIYYSPSERELAWLRDLVERYAT